MQKLNRYLRHYRSTVKQQGVAAVEFAIVILIFLMLFFGIVELARAMYIVNTLQEVTRRAAALAVNTDFSDATAMANLRQRAVLRTTPGLLVFADPVSDQHVKIDYLHIPLNSSVPLSITALPATPQENRVNCATNPNAENCIRLVRARICLPNGVSAACEPVPYRALVSLVPFSFALSRATTVATVETLGLPPGVPCDC
ncbi:TadE/TadG family type IV pilus assembly protein [Massilia sp. CMS3.1]|uniref:TadE/TadG family type IV pilus assembly protein n=1 Tax=Massilia sp. CMS3.1 TaxID=3373083 RepID=UPI003EE5CA12